MRLIFIILLSLGLLISCSDNKSSRSGKSKNFEVKNYKNGILAEVYGAYLLNGDTIKDGEYRNYYLSNGRLRALKNYKDGKLNGLQKELWENGVTDFSHEFINDEPKDGEFINYDRKGNIRAKRLVVGGKYEGELYRYYPNGKISELLFYKNDELDHVIYAKDSLGMELPLGTLKSGTGTRFIYHPNGKLGEVWVMKNGELRWIPLSLDAQGNQRSSGNLIDGKGFRIRYDYEGNSDTLIED